MPRSTRPELPFEMKAYERHQTGISLLMSHFFLDYLREIYRAFDGDLALVIVLGEIAHHNMTAHFTGGGGVDREAITLLAGDEGMRKRLPACNAFSLAAATGMPRETIRRKIAILEKLGWVERGERREVRITPKVSEYFQPDFNLNLLAGLLQTSDRIRSLMGT